MSHDIHLDYNKATAEMNYADDPALRNIFKVLETEWIKTHNPVYLQKAIHQAGSASVRLPEWLNKVLLEAFSKLIDNGGAYSLEEALGFTPSIFKTTSTAQVNEFLAGIINVAEDAGFSPGEAADLANYELKYVLGAERRVPESLKKVKSTYTPDPRAYFKIFWTTISREAGPAFYAAVNPSWHQRALKARYEAYRGAELEGLAENAVLHEVTRKTISALMRNMPEETMALKIGEALRDTGDFGDIFATFIEIPSDRSSIPLPE